VVDIGFVCSVCLSSKFFPPVRARLALLERAREGSRGPERGSSFPRFKRERLSLPDELGGRDDLGCSWICADVTVFCKPIPACQMCK
jgi:hypothetical protein